MAQSSSPADSSTLDLGTRLARLQDPTLSYTIPQLEAMDVNELGAFQIDFGRKFVGKTFAEALEASPEWGKWCCDHLKDSPKQKHRALLIYIRKYVEQAEKIETELQASCPSDLPKVTKTSKATPKVKAGGKSKSSSVDEPWDVIEAEGSAVEDQVSALAGHVDQQVLALNGRMGQMEQIMQQVLGAIQELQEALQTTRDVTASVLLQPSNIASRASSADDACANAYARAEEVAWATFQDSQLKSTDPAGGCISVHHTWHDESAAPSVPSALPDVAVSNPVDVPVPGSDEGLFTETVYLASEDLGIPDEKGDNLFTFTHLETSGPNSGPPLAEDGLPFVEEPLTCSEQQAFCLEIPMKAKSYRQCLRAPREQMSLLATISKRAKSEVYLKDLNAQERQLFDQAKDKEIQCWLQTSAIKAVLRRSLNPEQILRSRWILTWKSPEPGESQRKAKARLVVLGFQDPKLVEVMRDAPTLSREGRAIVLQSVASSKFTLTSFDIKTAFLRGKADANNPLAMEPPVELRRALNLKDSEVCQLLGNAYGRVDAPLLFYKELCKQLLALGFTRHPLEPCVFMLYTEQQLSGVLGMHVDDGVGGGDARFNAKLQELAKTLPFGSRKTGEFVFTGIHLQQLPDQSIKASQSSYVQNIPQIDIGRPRRLTPDALITEPERSKLRGLVGSLQYAVTHTRPDVAAKLGEVQGQITTATVQTLLLANKVLREAQEYHQVCTYFLPIKPEELTFVSFGENTFFRWIPTTLQVADSLTKPMD
ncbi:RE1, partial [Symbiodinium sp. KB8]